MVEKRIEITESQDEALKALADKSGVSEAEIIHRALVEFLLNSQRLISQNQETKGLDDFLTIAEEVSKKHGFPEGYRFSRDELYGEYNVCLPEESSLQKVVSI